MWTNIYIVGTAAELAKVRASVYIILILFFFAYFLFGDFIFSKKKKGKKKIYNWRRGCWVGRSGSTPGEETRKEDSFAEFSIWEGSLLLYVCVHLCRCKCMCVLWAVYVKWGPSTAS